MDSLNEARHSSLLETKTFCDLPANNTIWSPDASFSGDYATFLSKLSGIDAQKLKHAAIIIGHTIDKANKEGLVIRDLLFIGPRIQTWASPANNNNPGVDAAAAFAESSLQKLKDTDLLTKAQNIDKMMTDFPTIVPTFVTAARRGTFQTNITNYGNVIEMPEDKIDERATATSAMKTGIKDTMAFRKKELVRDAKLFRETNPDFFSGFKQTMKIDQNPVRHLALNGDITDEKTGETIAHVTCLIAELGLIKKSAEKGNFQFKSLAPGQYTILFTKFGYEPVQQVIFINAGERTELHIKMRRVA